MARSINELNEKIFRRLEEQIPAEERNLLINTNRRVTATAEERELIKKAKIEDDIFCLPQKRIIGISYLEEFYIVLPHASIEAEPFMRGIVKQKNNNTGILSILWGELDYEIRNVDKDFGFELIQYIFGRSDLDYAFTELQDFFASCDIWEIDPDFFGISTSDKALISTGDYDQRLRTAFFRVYGGYLSIAKQRLSLAFENDTLLMFNRLLEDPPAIIIGEAVFKAMTSTHWEHAFLELYRCVERMYSVPKINKLMEGLGKHLSIGEIMALVKDTLGWHPKEEDALIDIFEIINRPELNANFKIALATDVDSNSAIGKKLYGLRNQIAHWRPSGDIPNLPTDWNALLRLLSEFILDIYFEYKSVYL